MIITLANLKDFLEVTSSNYDDQLTVILDGLNKYIKSYLNKDISEITYNELYDGSGNVKLLLDNYPIIEILLLSDDIDKDNQEYDSTITIAEILLHKDAGIIELYNQSFAANQKNIYVKYKAGYTGATIPEDLKMILYEMAAKKYYDFKDKRYGMLNKTVMDETVGFSIVDVTPQQRQILNIYRGKPRQHGISVTAYTAA